MNKINFDGVIDDGTAIGMGLATAVNRLKDSRAKAKYYIIDRWCEQLWFY